MEGRKPQRWAGHPWAGRAVRFVALVTPFLVSIAFVRLVAVWVEPPTGSFWGFAGWWVALCAASSLVLWAVDRVARRLLPLAALLRLSLAFPDQTPSRFELALRAGRLERLEDRIELARQTGRPSTAQEAAERLLVLSAALDRHDRITRGHSERVRAYAVMIGQGLGLGPDDLDRLNWAALLHDIGKLAVSPDILNKPGRPTEEEWQSLRKHPLVGEKMLGPVRAWLGPWADAVGYHHERWDGKGYPREIEGAAIPLPGRIVALADVFDVITSARSYKQAASTAEARQEIARCAGTHFDPKVVRAFLDVSLGRLRLVMGPLSWLAHAPLLGRIPLAPITGVATSAAAVVTAATVSGVVPPQTALAGPAPVPVVAIAAPVAPAGPKASPTPKATRATTRPTRATRTVRPTRRAPVPRFATVGLGSTLDRGPRPSRPGAHGPATPSPVSPFPAAAEPSPASPGDAGPATTAATPHAAPAAAPTAVPPAAKPTAPKTEETPRPKPSAPSPGTTTATTATTTTPKPTPPAATPGKPTPGTPAPGGGGTTPGGGTGGGQPGATPAPVNHAPTVALAGDVQVAEDTAQTSRSGWATVTSIGAGDRDQATSFTITTDRPELFASPPVLSPSGTLTFTPAADASGTAHVTVRAVDDGGTANGGSDASAPRSAAITITPVNDAPTAAPVAGITLAEDAPAQTMAGWLTGVGPGAGEGDQKVTVTLQTDQPGLFAVGPTVNAAGALQFTPAPDANGVARLVVTLTDDGGTAGGGVDTTTVVGLLTLTPTNDAPTLKLGPAQVVVLSTGLRTVAGFATATTGPPDEAGQTVAYSVSTNRPDLFSVQPSIDPSGTLRYAPSIGLGVATVTVRVTDSGGGSDTGAPEAFTVTVVL